MKANFSPQSTEFALEVYKGGATIIHDLGAGHADPGDGGHDSNR